MSVRTRLLPLRTARSLNVAGSVSLALMLSFCFASLASAQYLERSEDGYMPQQGGNDGYLTPSGRNEGGYLPPPKSGASLNMSRAGSESGFYSQGPPPLRWGIALDFGAGGLKNKRLDSDFYTPNSVAPLGGVTSLSYDVNLYMQLMDSFRVGLNVGQLTGGKTGRQTDLLRAGIALEAGKRFYTGWGLWAGATLGYGRAQSLSRTVAPDYNEYSYQATGLGVRGFMRVERELAPFITLRLTPFVDTLVRTSEFYQEDVVASAPPMIAPVDTKGTFVGYGIMLGVSIHSF